MRQKLVFVLFLAITSVSIVLFSFLNHTDKQTVEVGEHKLAATVLNNGPEFERGLSGTKHLPDDQVMLFNFGRDDKWGIWMKDMLIPIDIVWLNKDKRAIKIMEDVKPETYPQTFHPDENARFVLEFAAGSVSRTGLKPGDKVKFNL